MLDCLDVESRVLKVQEFTLVKTLEDGGVFGELALINSQRRAARIVCSKDCVFGVLQKQAYKDAVNSAMNKELQLKSEFLL